jgi:two-component system sensor histidine kinase SenX3
VNGVLPVVLAALGGLVAGAVLASVMHRWAGRSGDASGAVAVPPGAVMPDPSAAPTAPSPTRVPDAAGSSGAAGVGDLLRSVVEGLDSGVVLRGPDGSEIYRNPAARRFAEARDGHVLVAAAVEDLLDEAAAQGTRGRREVELIGPPVESFVVTAAPFRPDGTADGTADGTVAGSPDPGTTSAAVAVVEDRSLQRRTETVRRDFVANISHELKTPIGALGLLAETLRDEVAADDPDRDAVQRLADRLIVESDRAAATVDDLLELSRIEFGDDADFVPVRVADVVDEATARLSPAAEQAGIALHCDVPADLTVVGDRRQLVSAVVNLVDNALKYSPNGSEVAVGATGSDRTVRVVVADEGVGVPRRDLDRIFERFYRVDRARSRETGGTGLGLAIVRHVASNHGGDVRVDSTEGAGSTFTLVLPAGGLGAPAVGPGGRAS